MRWCRLRTNAIALSWTQPLTSPVRSEQSNTARCGSISAARRLRAHRSSIGVRSRAIGSRHVRPGAQYRDAGVRARLGRVLNAPHIFIGVNAVDYSRYPDCRPRVRRGVRARREPRDQGGSEGTLKFEIATPAHRPDEGAIIRRGLDLGVDFSLTVSCYRPNAQGRACGVGCLQIAA